MVNKCKNTFSFIQIFDIKTFEFISLLAVTNILIPNVESVASLPKRSTSYGISKGGKLSPTLYF